MKYIEPRILADEPPALDVLRSAPPIPVCTLRRPISNDSEDTRRTPVIGTTRRQSMPTKGILSGSNAPSKLQAEVAEADGYRPNKSPILRVRATGKHMPTTHSQEGKQPRGPNPSQSSKCLSPTADEDANKRATEAAPKTPARVASRPAGARARSLSPKPGAGAGAIRRRTRSASARNVSSGCKSPRPRGFSAAVASESPRIPLRAKRTSPAAGAPAQHRVKKHRSGSDGEMLTARAAEGSTCDPQSVQIGATDSVLPEVRAPLGSSQGAPNRHLLPADTYDTSADGTCWEAKPARGPSPVERKLPNLLAEEVAVCPASRPLADHSPLPTANRRAVAPVLGAEAEQEAQNLADTQASPEANAGQVNATTQQRVDDGTTAEDAGETVEHGNIRGPPNDNPVAVSGESDAIARPVVRNRTNKRTAGELRQAPKRARQTTDVAGGHLSDTSRVSGVSGDTSTDDTPSATSSGHHLEPTSLGGLAARFALGSKKLLHFAQKLRSGISSRRLKRPPLDNTANATRACREPIDWAGYRNAMHKYVQSGDALGLASLADTLSVRLQNDAFCPTLLYPPDLSEEEATWRLDLFSRALLVAVERDNLRALEMLLRCAQARITEALREACRRGKNVAAYSLLKGAASIRWRDASEALKIACRQGNISLVRWIAGNIQRMTQQPQGFLESGILVGWKYGHLAVVDALVSAGANVNEIWDERLQVVGHFCICCDGNTDLCTAAWRCCINDPNPFPYCGTEWRVSEPLRCDTWFTLWRKGLWENWDLTIAKYLHRKGAVSARDETPQNVLDEVASTLAAHENPVNQFDQVSNERRLDIIMRHHRLEGVNDRSEEAELDAEMDVEKKKLKRSRRRSNAGKKK